MEQLIIKPLEEGYETIRIRTTNFENYNACPFKYKFEPKKDPGYLPFVFGNKMHVTCQGYLLARKKGDDEFNAILRDTLVDMIHRQYPEGILVREATEKTPELRQPAERFRTYINELERHYSNEEFIIAEFSNGIEIHAATHKIIITGSLDLLTTKFCVVDLKTASKAWSDESVKDKLQKLIYLYGIYKLMGKEDIRFEYAVLRSDLKREQNVKLQAVRTHLDVPAIEYVLTDLCEKFIYSLEHNVRPTRQGDYCRYCGLGPKGNNECPLFNKKPIGEPREESR